MTDERTSATKRARRADAHAAAAHNLIADPTFEERDGVVATVEALLAIDSRLDLLAHLIGGKVEVEVRPPRWEGGPL